MGEAQSTPLTQSRFAIAPPATPGAALKNETGKPLGVSNAPPSQSPNALRERLRTASTDKLLTTYAELLRSLSISEEDTKEILRNVEALHVLKIETYTRLADLARDTALYRSNTKARLGEVYEQFSAFEAKDVAEREYARIEQFALASGSPLPLEDAQRVKDTVFRNSAYSERVNSDWGLVLFRPAIPVGGFGEDMIRHRKPVMDQFQQAYRNVLSELEAGGASASTLAALKSYYDAEEARNARALNVYSDSYIPRGRPSP